MRGFSVFCCCVCLLVFLCPCALAQTVSCPEARVVLTVPDSWAMVPLTAADDPDLRLLLRGDDLILSLYVTDASGLPPEGFQVFTGTETESGTAVFSGMQMDYVAGSGYDGDYRIYTWLDQVSQVQFYFLIQGSPKQARTTIEEIMAALVFN